MKKKGKKKIDSLQKKQSKSHNDTEIHTKNVDITKNGVVIRSYSPKE